MRAALVNAFDKPPTFGTFPRPTPRPSDVLIQVKASAVTAIVRVSATGALTPGGPLPFIPGLDGVGRLEDNPSARVYFAFPTPLSGGLADTVAISRSNVIPVPDHLTDIEAAALANPAVSSWVALTRRARFKRRDGPHYGATGIAGRVAVQIAKHLGAGRIVATGHNKQRLEEAKALGADEVIALDGTKEEMVGRFKVAIQSGVDVILDYLWGPSAEQLLTACINTGSRTEQARRIRWINIGSASEQVASVPAFPFRSSNLEPFGQWNGA